MHTPTQAGVDSHLMLTENMTLLDGTKRREDRCQVQDFQTADWNCQFSGLIICCNLVCFDHVSQYLDNETQFHLSHVFFLGCI